MPVPGTILPGTWRRFNPLRSVGWYLQVQCASPGRDRAGGESDGETGILVGRSRLHGRPGLGVISSSPPDWPGPTTHPPLPPGHRLIGLVFWSVLSCGPWPVHRRGRTPRVDGTAEPGSVRLPPGAVRTRQGSARAAATFPAPTWASRRGRSRHGRPPRLGRARPRSVRETVIRRRSSGSGAGRGSPGARGCRPAVPRPAWTPRGGR